MAHFSDGSTTMLQTPAHADTEITITVSWQLVTTGYAYIKTATYRCSNGHNAPAVSTVAIKLNKKSFSNDTALCSSYSSIVRLPPILPSFSTFFLSCSSHWSIGLPVNSSTRFFFLLEPGVGAGGMLRCSNIIGYYIRSIRHRRPNDLILAISGSKVLHKGLTTNLNNQ
jgi:hypothetical protein